MEISAAQVKALREKTGAGMMDCKAALAECKGNVEAAIEHLRKMGRDAAVKRVGRTAAEGLVDAFLHTEKPVGLMVEVNCETDFVARTDEFKNFVKDLATNLAGERLDDGVVVNPELELRFGGGTRGLGDLAKEKSGKLGENVVVRRFARFGRSGPGRLEAYIHPGGRVGVLVEVRCGSDAVAGQEEFRVLVRDLSMQIAAACPLVVRREEVDPALVEKEREIYREIARGEKKPENVIDKIVEGRLQKFYKENVLLEQEFVKDQGGKKRSISALLKEKGGALGEEITIARFARFQLGEMSSEG
jgi:elongation factor Ts